LTRRRLPIPFAAFIAVAGIGLSTLSGCSRPSVHGASAEAAAVIPVYGDGVSVAGVDITGMTEEQAGHAVRLALKTKPERKVTLRHRDHTYARTWSALGVTSDVPKMLQRAWTEPNVPLICKVDMGAAKRSISRAAMALAIRPIPPRFVGGPGSAVKDGKPGRTVDVYASALYAKDKLEKDADADTLALVVKPVAPPFTASDLESITTKVVSFTTAYNPGDRNRTHNLRMVAERLDGALVEPGDVFSFNRWVGERKESDGFREAIVYKKGKMVKDTAGGLCQVSSTLYNVALLAGLPIVERTRHSLTVHYVPLGRDATIYWGQLDLKFRNDTGMPLYIRAVPGRSRLTIEAWGSAPLDREVKVTSSSHRRDGKAIASVYRTISEDGTEKSERISTDTYSMEHTMAPSTSANRRG
jgi:vancomycin resistance protein YoaR